MRYRLNPVLRFKCVIEDKNGYRRLRLEIGQLVRCLLCSLGGFVLDRGWAFAALLGMGYLGGGGPMVSFNGKVSAGIQE